MPIPLTGAAALAAGQDWEPNTWQVNFLRAMTREAEAALDLLYRLERDWFEARRNLAHRRKGAHDAAAVDVLAAAPAMSATTLARILKIAIKNAIRILDDLVESEIAIEITHRSKRRLFGLKNLAPLRDEIRPPYRPDNGPGRGQYPRFLVEAEEPASTLPPAPLSPIERRTFDYSALEEAMSGLDDVVRQARGRLSVFVSGK